MTVDKMFKTNTSSSFYSVHGVDLDLSINFDADNTHYWYQTDY